MDTASTPDIGQSIHFEPVQSTSQAMDAAKPFDSSAKADIILRSSDSVDFFVIKLLLSSVSGVFDATFAKLEEEGETRDGLHIIAVDENSAILRQLLLLIYAHIDEAPMFDDTNLCTLGMAARNRSIEHLVEKKLKNMVLIPQLGSIDAFRVFVTSVHLGWRQLLDVAAKKTWNTPLQDLAQNEELRRITGADFYRYLAYRLRDNNNSKTTDKLVRSASSSPGSSHPESYGDVGVDPPSPFNSTAEADFILRSSDSVDFYVLKSFLAFVSPRLRDIISNVEKTPPKNSLSMLTVDEGSRTLRNLLLLIYPCVEEPRLETLESYFTLRAAAVKYRVSVVNHKLERLILGSPWMREQPLRVFALAVRFSWKEAMRAAALSTLMKPLTDIAFVEELNHITGHDLFQLVKYRFACVHAACGIVDTADPIELYEHSRIIIPKRSVKLFKAAPPDLDMVVRYLNDTRTRLVDCPRGPALLDSFKRETAALNSFNSVQIPARLNKLLDCRNVLVSAIDDAVLKISLEIGSGGA